MVMLGKMRKGAVSVSTEVKKAVVDIASWRKLMPCNVE
jgi:hypothetical protein